MAKRITISLFIIIIFPYQSFSWGFFAHRLINRMAVFALPSEMVPFYKHNIQYITENAVNPDRRRYSVKGEAARHYLDADVYGDSAVYKLPRYWNEAVEKYTEDTLSAYGIVPWHIFKMKNYLTKAFFNKDLKNILRLSADIGHYIGDANVPLHTTENYNGQLTGQYGIHGFWESRLPELFSDQYDFFLPEANYIEKPQLKAWEAVINAHSALDSVLLFEKELSNDFSEDKKYSYEQRGQTNVRVYSRDYSIAYHDKLDGQVERRMRAAIKMIADFWYTCWVDGGQPDLNSLIRNLLEKEVEELRDKKEGKVYKGREHES